MYYDLSNIPLNISPPPETFAIQKYVNKENEMTSTPLTKVLISYSLGI